MTGCQMNVFAFFNTFDHLSIKSVLQMIGHISNKLMVKKLLLFLDNSKCKVDFQITLATHCLHPQIVAKGIDSGSTSKMAGYVGQRIGEFTNSVYFEKILAATSYPPVTNCSLFVMQISHVDENN